MSNNNARRFSTDNPTPEPRVHITSRAHGGSLVSFQTKYGCWIQECQDEAAVDAFLQACQHDVEILDAQCVEAVQAADAARAPRIVWGIGGYLLGVLVGTACAAYGIAKHRVGS